MNGSNLGKLRQLMNRMRTGRGLRSPNSAPDLFQSFGMFSKGLDRISMLMQQYSIDRNIPGMSDPDALNKASAIATMGMKLGGVSGARLMQSFVRDNYRFAVDPALRAIGKVGGRYGYILENYLQAKSDIKRSWGDIGANIGQAAAFGISLFSKGLKVASLATAATGIGIPVALAGVAVSVAIETILGAILPWIGRKIGETIAEKGGFVQKFSVPTLGRDMIGLVPENANHFKSVASSVVGQNWYRDFDSYLATMKGIAYNDDSNGTTLHDVGMTVQETGTLYDSIGKSMLLKPELRGYYTRQIGTIQGITGEDVSSTFSSISQGSALSKRSVTSGEIDSTADAFNKFLTAVSQGGSATAKSAINLTKSLSAAADHYARKNLFADDVDKTFAGVQKFVQKNMQAEGKQDTTEATDIIGIMDGIAKASFKSPLASNLSNLAGITMADGRRGLDSDKFTRLSKALSSSYNFGGDSSIQNGVLKLGRKGENAWAKLFLDATAGREEGGLGLIPDQAEKLIKYVVGFQTKGEDLDFDFKNGTALTTAGREIRLDQTMQILQQEVVISDNYQKLAGLFTKDFIKLGYSVARVAASTTERIAAGAFDLLDVAWKLTGGDTSGVSIGPEGVPVVITGYTTASMKEGSLVDNKTMLVAQAGFREEISDAAGAAGLELKTLYAFLGAESRFGNVTGNYRNMDYVGVGQIGQAAQDDMNRLHKTHLDRFNRKDNILLAAYYADYLRDRYVKLKSTTFKNMNFDPNDPRVIYMAYNWGFGNLDNHIRKYGGINWDALPAETKVGVGNVEKALRGYDAVQGKAIYAPAPASSAVSSSHVQGVTTGRIVKDAKGAWRYTGEGLGKGRFDSNVTLLSMSGKNTKIGNSTAQYMEDLYKRSANTNAFYQACARIANQALSSAGFNVQSYKSGATAEADLGNWMRGGHAGAVMSYAEAQKEGFQAGDMLYVLGGNHVGIVTFDGSVIQAGTAYDGNRRTNLIRTDINEFTYGRGIIVIRPSQDVSVRGTEAARVMYTAKPSTTEIKNVQKTVKGSEVMVNALVKGNSGTFSVKSNRGAGLSKGQVAKIKGKEAALEKILGLSADQLTLDSTAVQGGSVLNVRINAPMGDVGKIAQDLIREIERIL